MKFHFTWLTYQVTFILIDKFNDFKTDDRKNLELRIAVVFLLHFCSILPRKKLNKRKMVHIWCIFIFKKCDFFQLIIILALVYVYLLKIYNIYTCWLNLPPPTREISSKKKKKMMEGSSAWILYKRSKEYMWV